MAKLQADIPEELSDQLKIYKIRWKKHTLAEAVVDILQKYFSKGIDEDYFVLVNSKKPADAEIRRKLIGDELTTKKKKKRELGKKDKEIAGKL